MFVDRRSSSRSRRPAASTSSRSVHPTLPTMSAVASALVLAAGCAGADRDQPSVTEPSESDSAGASETTSVAPVTAASGDPTVVTTGSPTTSAPTEPAATQGPTSVSVDTAAAETSTNETTAAETSTNESPSNESAAADCLVGDWVVSGQELAAYYDVVAAETGYTSIVPSGRFDLGFTGSVFAFSTDVDLDLRLDVEGDSSEYTFGLTSTSTGGYVVDGNLIVDPDGDPSGSGITVSRSDVTRDGAPVDDVGDLLVGIVPVRPFEPGAAYSCDGPTIAVPAGTTGRSVELELSAS